MNSTAESSAVKAPAPSADLSRRLRTGVGWNSVGTIFSQGSTFAVNVIVANALGRRSFGEYALVLSTLATFSNVAQLAMGSTATRFLAELRGVDKPRAGRILAACGVLTLTSAVLVSTTLLLAARGIAEKAYREPDLAGLFAIASAALLFAVLNGFLLGALAGLEAFRLAGIVGIASGCIYLVAGVVGVGLGGLAGLMTGVAVSSVAQATLLFVGLKYTCRRQGIQVRWDCLRRERSALAHYATPAALAGISQMSSLWLAGLILARQGDGMSQVALFAAANSFWSLVMFLPSMVNNVGQSLIFNARGSGDGSALRGVFRSTLRINAFVTILGGLACALAAPLLMALFGRDFSGGVLALVVLLFSTVPCAAWYAVTHVVASGGSMWTVLLTGVLPRDASLIALSWLLAPRLGALGLSVAVCVAWVVGLLSVSPAFRRAMIAGAPTKPESAS